MYKVGIIGATGYAGAEIVRILLNHPYVELAAVGSRSYKGKKLSEVYPNFKNICDMILLDNEDVIEKSDVVFAALPHGLSQDIAKKCYDSNVFFIDIGADFRLHDEQDYKEWYGLEFDHRQLHNEAVYGLPELFGEQIKGKRIIANPGCYPTS
ncbi:MAG: NAD(P)-binding domain-containing protein, partial [bacterium]|nr:NAD(P)-binding domain-containing protein [bacterium]